ncbi:MAG TPA: protein-disulfide reductase DsbD domain-containing protein [Candidatus Sphingobacterium stercoripullorum]|nr:protein-disulfide reductase DsbD domain-containing protein [Candidatus Sphingobacterium stercoripullorum]
MKKINAILVFMMLFAFGTQAQIFNPVKWSVAVKKLDNKENEAVVFIKGTIDNGWYIYSTKIEEGGPIATSFTFEKSKDYNLVGDIAEPKAQSKYEEVFDMDVAYFAKQVVFQQKVKLNKKGETVVKGTVEWQACDADQCLPPDEHTFAVKIQ